jgi:methyltransferase (TIGR00027 family)
MSNHAAPAPSLAATAYWTAAVRAREAARLDRLFDDPWAAALAGEPGQAWIAQRPPDSTIPIVLRTRYFDDFLQRVAAGDAIRQIVVLAAGLDTRAFRLAWPPGTQWYELDQPAVLRHKAEVLEAASARPACERRAIETDLTGPWPGALAAAGFDPRQPSAWLLEGFMFYLPNEAIARILDQVTESAAPGSWLGFDIINSAVLTSPWTRPWVEMQAASGAPWIGALDDPAGFLAERGWQTALTQAGQPDANHGRWTLPILPVAAPGMPHNWYVTAYRTL